MCNLLSRERYYLVFLSFLKLSFFSKLLLSLSSITSSPFPTTSSRSRYAFKRDQTAGSRNFFFTFLVILFLALWSKCWGDFSGEEQNITSKYAMCSIDEDNLIIKDTQLPTCLVMDNTEQPFEEIESTDYVSPGVVSLIVLLNAPEVVGALGNYHGLTTWGSYVGLSILTASQQIISRLPQDMFGKDYLIVAVVGSAIAVGGFLADSNSYLTGCEPFVFGPDYFADFKANVVVNTINGLSTYETQDLNLGFWVLLQVSIEAGSVLAGEWLMTKSPLTPRLPVSVSVPLTFGVAAGVRTEVISLVNQYIPYEKGVTYSDIGNGCLKGLVMGTMVYVIGIILNKMHAGIVLILPRSKSHI